jgi:hypothetical protein
MTAAVPLFDQITMKRGMAILVTWQRSRFNQPENPGPLLSVRLEPGTLGAQRANSATTQKRSVERYMGNDRPKQA